MNGHLTHSVTPRLLQFSPFWPVCFLCPKPSSHTELCCSPHTEKQTNVQLTTSHLFQFLHWLPIQQRIQYKINCRCYKCIMITAPSYIWHLRTLSKNRTNELRLTSVTVFNFTHPPVLSDLLLILSTSRFLAPDSPLLAPIPRLFCFRSVNME